MRVALVVDNPYRDLPGLVLTAMALNQRGATCFLVPMNMASTELWALAPDVAVLNYLRPNNAYLARGLKAAGVRVVVLDTEGGVFSSMEHYEKSLATDADLRYGLDRYLSWGPLLAEAAAERGWYHPAQLAVTGQPRFDFYVPPWRQAALDASPYAAEVPGPLILLNGNFPLVNPAFKTPEQEARMLVEMLGHPEEQVRGWVERQEQTLTGMAALANALAERFPQASVVVRPHPFEGLARWQSMLDDRPNLHLRREGAADGWILRAAAVVQRSCSTAIEAAVAGVPALTPAWLPTAVVQETAERVSIQCETPDALFDCVGAAITGTLTLPDALRAELDALVAEWFLRMDGKAHARVADEIAALATQPGTVDARATRRAAYGMAARPDVRWQDGVRGAVRSALGLPLDWSYRQQRNRATGLKWDRSPKAYTTEDVQRLVEAIQPIAQDVYGESWRTVRAASTPAGGGYRTPYLRGRAVTLATANG